MPFTDVFRVSATDLKPLDALGLLDVDALRLVLEGGSVIDWRRLAFTTREQVDHYLRLCCFDPSSPSDQSWMRGVLQDSAAYVSETFHHPVPSAVCDPAEIHDVFLQASGAREPQYQRIACIVLKVCDVIHHIEGRDLFHRLPLAEEAFGEMASVRVMAVFRQMIDAGFPILEATASAKTRASLISKLLQKTESVAATIYDRTRFRVVVAQHTDVLPVLHCLTQRLFPFHVVVPGHTRNSLVDFHEVCASMPAWRNRLGDVLAGSSISRTPELEQSVDTGRNESSGASYRVLKFVIDLPLRIEERLISPEISAATRARTVPCLVEIQMVDAATARANEQGENDHERYKHRQRARVLRRLSRGLETPAGDRREEDDSQS